MSWNAPGPEDRIPWRTILLLVAGCGFLLIVGTQSIRMQQRAYFTTPAAVSDHEQRLRALESRTAASPEDREQASRYEGVTPEDYAIYRRVRAKVDAAVDAEAEGYRESFPVQRSPDLEKSHLQQPGESYRDWYRRVGPIIPAG